MKFIKNKNGIWDSSSCYECCSDCSACEADCTCPLEFEGTCDNCVFNRGYVKCTECCTNSRTNNDKYIQLGYSHMCDTCIDKYNDK